jgi:hypothetical protein
MTTEDLARELDEWADVLSRITTLPVDSIRAAAARLRELSALVDEAAEEIETWGAYAGEYFQAKWDLAGTVERFRRAAQLTETRRD